MTEPLRSPSMTWVRAFCEAARRGSFKAAAAALHVSPSTISHEVRKLEDWTRVPLFRRTGRGIELTDEGTMLYESVVVGFDHLDRAFDRLTNRSSLSLRLGMLPFVASEFVLPRLPQLQALLQDDAVELLSNNHLADLDQVDPQRRVDAVIRYADDPPAGYQSVPLTTIQLGVVTGPAHTDGQSDQPLRRIRGSNLFDAWQVIDAAASVPIADPGAPIVVDNYLSGLRAVEQRLGIGVVILPLSTSWLTEGRIRLHSTTLVDIPQRYWLMYASSSPRRTELARVGEWLQAEFAEQRRKLAQHRQALIDAT